MFNFLFSLLAVTALARATRIVSTNGNFKNSLNVVPDVIVHNLTTPPTAAYSYKVFTVQAWIASGNTTATMSAAQKNNATIQLVTNSNDGTVSLSKRGNLGGVFLCTDKNWTGNCLYLHGGANGQCINLGVGWNDALSSFGPDQKNACVLFSASSCQTANGPALGNIKYPGIPNLDAPGVPINLNDQVSSYSCTW